MAKKQKSEPEEPTPLAIATCHSHLAIARLVMANNRKQPKKCHFDLKRQNNEVSITKNQMVAKKKKKKMTYSNTRLAAARL